MLTIRLTRVGKKKDASFRVIVVDSKRKVKAGNYLEMVGSYDPRIDKATLKTDRIKHWISQGAQPSDTLHNLLITHKIIEGKKINVLPRKSPPAKEAAGAEPGGERPRLEREQEGSAPQAQATEDNSVAADAPADTITE